MLIYYNQLLIVGGEICNHMTISWVFQPFGTLYTGLNRCKKSSACIVYQKVYIVT